MLNSLVSVLQGGAGAAATAYESIATVTASGGETSLTFSSIPSTYTHLQLRFSALEAAGNNITMQFNNDNANNYVYHYLVGTGSAAYAGSVTATNKVVIEGQYNGTVGTYPNVGIVDILDYTNTSKNKTVRSLSGGDNNSTTGEISLNSGLWLNTASISTIKVLASASFDAGSSFALYGIKGA